MDGMDSQVWMPPTPTPTWRRGSRSKAARQLKNGPQTPVSSAHSKYHTLELLQLIKHMTCVQKFNLVLPHNGACQWLCNNQGLQQQLAHQHQAALVDMTTP